MMEMKLKQKKSVAGKVFGLCPFRHVVLFLSALVTGLYFLLRTNKVLTRFVCDNIVRPFHGMAGKVSSSVSFSLAELFYTLAVILIMIYIIYTVISIIRKKNKFRRLYVFAITLLMAGLAVYSGSCVLWGVLFYGDSFGEKSGINTKSVEVSELEAATHLFADLANEYSSKISRDSSGLFSETLDSVFERAPEIYVQAEKIFETLTGDELMPKRMFFSKVMSYMNFTGFFFPLTGEANINTDCAAALIPATIAHEMAHQRGVAKEDEANFVAILACLESKDPIYTYSAALLAYIHLANALYGADYDSWFEINSSLDDVVRRDLDNNANYWKKYETRVATASEAVYTGYLKSQGEISGMKSYGGCIDLLVAYYGGKAKNG